jgi:hypothetical protein
VRANQPDGDGGNPHQDPEEPELIGLDPHSDIGYFKQGNRSGQDCKNPAAADDPPPTAKRHSRQRESCNHKPQHIDRTVHLYQQGFKRRRVHGFHGRPSSPACVCAAAGVPNLLFHDLRRTGARNLRRLGVAESVIMDIGGWKTREVFERYNIVNQEDLAEAAGRLDAKRENREIGHSLATVEGKQTKANGVANVQ